MACLISSKLLSDDAVPPHHDAGYEHRRWQQSCDGPDELGHLIAKPGPPAGNSYPVDSPEVQVGEPVDHLIDEPDSGIAVGRRLKPICEVLEYLGIAEVSPAQSKHNDD